MDIQLIATDLDGTALQNDHKTFSPRLCAALDAAHAQGKHIVPITGRQYSLLPPALKEVHDWDSLVVLCNGAEIRQLRTGKLCYGIYMSREQALGVLDLAREYQIPVEFSHNGVLHLSKEDWEFEKTVEKLWFHLTVLHDHGCRVTDLRAIIASQDIQYEKINLPWIPTEQMAPICERLVALGLSAVCSAGSFNSSSMEITHRDATKENGLRKACELLGVDIANTMCLGDSGNDASMLQAAGLSVAMGNAPTHIQALAHVVTDLNSNDGAAKAIEAYALK